MVAHGTWPIAWDVSEKRVIAGDKSHDGVVYIYICLSYTQAMALYSISSLSEPLHSCPTHACI